MSQASDALDRMVTRITEADVVQALTPDQAKELKALLDARAVTAGGTSMATRTRTRQLAADTEDATAVGATWAGVIAQEGVDTGDGRRIEKDALTWRALPLTMMAQHTTPEYGGHTDAAVAGRIDSLERDGENILATGCFDTGDWGAATERMVRDQMLRGISVDLAVNEAEVIPAEDCDDPMDAWFMGTLSIIDAVVLGATVVPFPAFENASIAIVAGAAMRLHSPRYEQVDGKRTMVLSFYMPFAPGDMPADDMPADSAKPDPDQAEDDAVEKCMMAVEDAVQALRDAIDADDTAESGD